MDRIFVVEFWLTVGTVALPSTREPFAYALYPEIMFAAAAAPLAIVVSTTFVAPLTPKIVAPAFIFALTRFASEQVLLAAEA